MPTLGIGSNRCECTGCGEFFNSVHAFDKHMVAATAEDETEERRRCLSVAEMEAKGFSKNKTGFWITAAWAGAKGDLENAVSI